MNVILCIGREIVEFMRNFFRGNLRSEERVYKWFYYGEYGIGIKF